jgi:hypothetical protein
LSRKFLEELSLQLQCFRQRLCLCDRMRNNERSLDIGRKVLDQFLVQHFRASPSGLGHFSQHFCALLRGCGALCVKFVRLGYALLSDGLDILWKANVLEELLCLTKCLVSELAGHDVIL